jgi:hypothetical protein
VEDQHVPILSTAPPAKRWRVVAESVFEESIKTLFEQGWTPVSSIKEEKTQK